MQRIELQERLRELLEHPPVVVRTAAQVVFEIVAFIAALLVGMSIAYLAVRALFG